MIVTCDYCGREGEYPTEVELRQKMDCSLLACVDRAACDERWEKNHPEEDE